MVNEVSHNYRWHDHSGNVLALLLQSISVGQMGQRVQALGALVVVSDLNIYLVQELTTMTTIWTSRFMTLSFMTKASKGLRMFEHVVMDGIQSVVLAITITIITTTIIIMTRCSARTMLMRFLVWHPYCLKFDHHHRPFLSVQRLALSRNLMKVVVLRASSPGSGLGVDPGKEITPHRVY